MVDAVSVKLPTFWTTSPTAWFAQAEAQFAIRGVTQDDTKYYHVVAALDTSTATRTVSLLSSPPTTDKYSAIKTFLISAYDLSDSERASALFNLPGLGDSKPSELMDSMLSLLGTHTPCFLFRHLFLQQLPDYVRAPLAPSSTDNYRALAQNILGWTSKLTRSQHTTTHPQSQIQQATDGQTMLLSSPLGETGYKV